MIPGVWVWQLGTMGHDSAPWVTIRGGLVARFDGVSVTWCHGAPIVDFGYPKYRYLGGCGTDKM